MKKRTFIITIIVFLSVSMPLNSNAENGGGHAIKIAEWKEDTRPYPVRVWNKFIEWFYGK